MIVSMIVANFVKICRVLTIYTNLSVGGDHWFWDTV